MGLRDSTISVKSSSCKMVDIQLCMLYHNYDMTWRIASVRGEMGDTFSFRVVITVTMEGLVWKCLLSMNPGRETMYATA